MAHHVSMSSDNEQKSPVAQMKEALDGLPGWLRHIDDTELGAGLIEMREVIDRTEAAFADGLRRFDKSGEFKTDGALSVVAWLRWKCKLSGGAAAERVAVARQIDKLPQTGEAFAKGEVGYQHVAQIARTAEHLGAAAVRKEESTLLKEAQQRDPSQFVGFVKDLEHRVDAEAAIEQFNRAYERRYLQISQSNDGVFHLDGLLDPEGGATLQTALNSVMKPIKDDERSAGQRRADALVDLSRRLLDGNHLPKVGRHRPHLIVTCSSDTLAGIEGAPAGQIEWGLPIPSETVRRLACDGAITRITMKGKATDLQELAAEISQGIRNVSAAVYKGLITRDHGCVFTGCSRSYSWCDAHHLKFWAEGGESTLDNLAFLCRGHHVMVHEGGWKLERKEDRFIAIRPPRKVKAQARSA
jgi:hypothetical protein